MKDIVSQEVFAKFPNYIRGVVIARGVDNHGEKPRLIEMLSELVARATQDESQVEYAPEGEVIYVDNSRVMCRRWNWRQGDHTKLMPETADVAINVDCLPPVTKGEAGAITEELAGLVREFCGGEVKHLLLDAANNEAEI